MGFVLPQHFAGVQVKAIHHPMVNALGRITHAFAQIQPALRLDVLFIGDHGRNEDAITHHDRAAPTLTGHVSDPSNILGLVPPGRQRGMIRRNARRIGTPKATKVIAT